MVHRRPRTARKAACARPVVRLLVVQARVPDLSAVRAVRDDPVQRNPHEVIIANSLWCTYDVFLATARRGSRRRGGSTSGARLRPSLPRRRPGMCSCWPLFPRGHEVFPRLVGNRDRVGWRRSALRDGVFIVKRTSFCALPRQRTTGRASGAKRCLHLDGHCNSACARARRRVNATAFFGLFGRHRIRACSRRRICASTATVSFGWRRARERPRRRTSVVTSLIHVMEHAIACAGRRLCAYALRVCFGRHRREACPWRRIFADATFPRT